MSTPKPNHSPNQKPLVEVLGDTVATDQILYAVLISLVLAFGGFWLGLRVFPKFIDAKLVQSYSLLLSMIGCVIGLIVNAKLFKPKRIVVESAAASETDVQSLIHDLQIDPEKELALLKDDPVTRAELEKLNLLDIFEKGGRASK